MYKLLIIDDSPETQKALSTMLRSAQYETLSCATAAEGLAAVVLERPDIVILDVVLPDGSGIDLCTRLKTMKEIRHIPVVLITGNAMEVESKMAGLECGADDYITKPFMPEELLSRVKGIIKRYFKT